MLLHNLSSVIDIIVYHLSIPNSLAIDSILKLVAILSRDMRFAFFPPFIARGELVQYYDKLLSTLLSLMNQKDPESTSSVFETLILMFRNLNGTDIRNNIGIIRKYYCSATRRRSSANSHASRIATFFVIWARRAAFPTAVPNTRSTS